MTVANFMLGMSAGIAFICCWMAWQDSMKRRFWIPFSIAFGLNGWRRLLAVQAEENVLDAGTLLAVSLLWLMAILIYRRDNR